MAASSGAIIAKTKIPAIIHAATLLAFVLLKFILPRTSKKGISIISALYFRALKLM